LNARDVQIIIRFSFIISSFLLEKQKCHIIWSEEANRESIWFSDNSLANIKNYKDFFHICFKYALVINIDTNW
jgi:hypothetical protein